MKEFEIPFSGLKIGKHPYAYQISNKFFEELGYREFYAANVEVKVTLLKTSTMLELEFRAKGTVNVDCDLTSEPYDQPISGKMELVVKFGNSFNNDDEDLLILPHGQYWLDISQYIYELIILSVPPKRVNPEVKEGKKGREIIRMLNDLKPGHSEQTDKTDPRWDKLKELFNTEDNDQK